MSVRQYIGARYVTKVYENSLDPSSAEWEQGTFEPLVMVTWLNSTYLSKKQVPGSVGNPADNPSYWVCTGYYNGQIMQLQNLVSRLQSIINTPEFYGAVGDGVTDDTQALKDALAIGSIYCKPGATYLISDGLEILSDTVIHGNGATIKLADNTQISFDPNGTVVNGVLYANIASNITIEDLIIDLNENNMPAYTDFNTVVNVGVGLYNTDNVHVVRCTFNGLYTEDIYDVRSFNLTVKDCIFSTGNRSQGLRGEFIYIVSHNASSNDTTVYGSSLIDNCMFSTSITDVQYGVCAVFLATCRGVKISHNTMLNVGRDNTYGHRVHPICLYSYGSNITISDNYIESIGLFFKIEDFSEVSVVRNTFKSLMLNNLPDPLIWCVGTDTSNMYHYGNVVIRDNEFNITHNDYVLMTLGTGSGSTKVVDINNTIIDHNKFVGPCITGQINVMTGVSMLKIINNLFDTGVGVSAASIAFTKSSLPNTDNLVTREIDISCNSSNVRKVVDLVDDTGVTCINIHDNIFDSAYVDSDFIINATYCDKLSIDSNTIIGGNIKVDANSTDVYVDDNRLYTSMTPVDGTVVSKNNNYNNGVLVT